MMGDVRLLYFALGIPGVGPSASKGLASCIWLGVLRCCCIPRAN